MAGGIGMTGVWIGGSLIALYVFLRTRAVDTGSGPGLAILPPRAPSQVARWADLASRHGRTFGVSPGLVLAVIWQESAGISSAVGDGGASKGLMQVKDIAAQDVGFNSAPMEPGSNIFVGTAFLAKQIERMGDDVYDGLRAYNQGEGGARAGKGHAYAREVLRKAGWR